jgi:hypothetical protein
MRGLIFTALAVLFCNVVHAGHFPSPSDGLLKHLSDKPPISLLNQQVNVRIPPEASAEARETLLIKSVSIFSLSKNHEPSSMGRRLKNLQKIALGNCPSLAQGMVERFSETNHSASGRNVIATSAIGIEGWERIAFLKGPFGQFDNCRDLDIVGWRETVVLKEKADSDLFIRLDSREITGQASEVSSQLPFGSQVGALYETGSRYPETPSRYSQNDGPDGDDALGVNPLKTAAPRKREPFFPVFGLGAATFLTGMFVGIHIYNRGSRTAGWHRYLLHCGAALIVGLCSFSFAFGFPWAAFF